MRVCPCATTRTGDDFPWIPAGLMSLNPRPSSEPSGSFGFHPSKSDSFLVKTEGGNILSLRIDKNRFGVEGVDSLLELMSTFLDPPEPALEGARPKVFKNSKLKRISQLIGTDSHFFREGFLASLGWTLKGSKTKSFEHVVSSLLGSIREALELRGANFRLLFRGGKELHVLSPANLVKCLEENDLEGESENWSSQSDDQKESVDHDDTPPPCTHMWIKDEVESAPSLLFVSVRQLEEPPTRIGCQTTQGRDLEEYELCGFVFRFCTTQLKSEFESPKWSYAYRDLATNTWKAAAPDGTVDLEEGDSNYFRRGAVMAMYKCSTIKPIEAAELDRAKPSGQINSGKREMRTVPKADEVRGSTFSRWSEPNAERVQSNPESSKINKYQLDHHVKSESDEALENMLRHFDSISLHIEESPGHSSSETEPIPEVSKANELGKSKCAPLNREFKKLQVALEAQLVTLEKSPGQSYFGNEEMHTVPKANELGKSKCAPLNREFKKLQVALEAQLVTLEKSPGQSYSANEEMHTVPKADEVRRTTPANQIQPKTEEMPIVSEAKELDKSEYVPLDFQLEEALRDFEDVALDFERSSNQSKS